MVGANITSTTGLVKQLLNPRSQKEEIRKDQFVRKHRPIEGVSGVIALAERAMSPNAVRTWVYSPKRYDLNATRSVTTKAQRDIHIYLDLLGSDRIESDRTESDRSDNAGDTGQRHEIAAAPDESGPSSETHRLLILNASHFPRPGGLYDYRTVFSKDYDFSLRSTMKASKVANIIIDQLAKDCLTLSYPLALSAGQWDQQVDSILRDLEEFWQNRHRKQPVNPDADTDFWIT